jgi:hypothetical protein
MPAAAQRQALEHEHRRHVHDRQLVALYTEGGDHVHVAVFRSDDGAGMTTPGPDGHVHRVVDLQVAGSHGHELSTRRAPWGRGGDDGPEYRRFARALLEPEQAQIELARRRR